MAWQGFIAAAISVLFFGSNFVPVKKFETGDGVFFQWILCSAIWMAGLIVQLARGSPEFQPLAMLGGVLWCSGNITVVPVVKMIGLSLGLLVWGTVNLLAGWASGTFGLFGLTKESVPHPALNYIGVMFAVLSVMMMAFIKTDVKSKVDSPDPDELGYEKIAHHRDELDAGRIQREHDVATSGPTDQSDSWVEYLSPVQRRVLGLLMAACAGILYGVNFDPPTYIMNHDKTKSQDGLDYVFSHFCGIYATSTFFLIVYCAIKRNRPAVFPQAILPGFLCGAMWAVAQISWFFANSELSLVVAFPIISTGPGMVASLWGIFVFHEIRGWRNYGVLLGSFALIITSAVLTSLSSIS